MSTSIFTLGHSSHTWERFSELVGSADVGAILDVRSSPRSRFSHFTSPEIRLRLNSIGVSYVYLGDQLGGRPKQGALSYKAMEGVPSFNCGIARALEIAGRCKSALLCSEHDPLSCHRCLLIGRHLHANRLADVRHILRDGKVEPHEETEERLLAQWDRGGDLFRDRDDRLDVAYRLQARKIGVFS